MRGSSLSRNVIINININNMIINKKVGEAVKEGQFLVSDGQKMRRGLKAIGICSWGLVTPLTSMPLSIVRTVMNCHRYTHAAEALVNTKKGEFRKVR